MQQAGYLRPILSGLLPHLLHYSNRFDGNSTRDPNSTEQFSLDELGARLESPDVVGAMNSIALFDILE